MTDERGHPVTGTKAVPIPGSVRHANGCNYYAPVFRIEGCGDFWFCNKCGQGDEVYPPGDSSREAQPDDR
jgi:hypothetical protein